MGVHRVYVPEIAEAGEVMRIGGDEAHHLVRVKRSEVGEAVVVCDGRGGVGAAEIIETKKQSGGWEVFLRVEEAMYVPRPAFRVEVWSAIPKGDRCEEMIDGLCQVGASEWSPLKTEWSIVDPREGKLARLERRALEATKQSGREWMMTIGEGGGLEEGMRTGRVIVADTTGEAFKPMMVDGRADVRVVIGPEAGLSEKELGLCRALGAAVASFGPHTMRIETAAVVAAAMIVNARPLQ